jgi:hypothetical protein
MTADLSAFLLARVSEWEAGAQDIDRQPHTLMCGYRMTELSIEPQCICNYPARVLAQCVAIRAVVGLWNADGYTNEDGEVHGGRGPETHHDVLRALATIWRDHPDYREEWS